MLQLPDLSNALDEIEAKPQKKTTLFKLRQSLEADYQKNLLVNVDKAEVDLLKYYFNKINTGVDLTIIEISKILDEYMEETSVEPYGKIIQGLKDDITTGKLSLHDFFDFTEKYVVQNYPIDYFYKKYFKRSPSPLTISDGQNDGPVGLSGSDSRGLTHPTMVTTTPTKTDLFGDELEDISSSESESEEDEGNDMTEQQKLEKIVARIKNKKVEPHPMVKVIQSETKPEIKGRVAIIKDHVVIPPIRIPEPKPITDKIFLETMTDLTKQDCEFLYKNIPWVKDVVNHIYVHPIEGAFEDILDMEKFIVHDGVEFYQPKKKYYSIQCHSNKIQEGNNLTIVKDDKTYKIMVAIDTNMKGIVLQNEDMLKAELDYIRVWSQSKNEHIRELKHNPPSEEMVLMARSDLSDTLQDAIKGNVPIAYRTGSSPFIETVVNTILNESKTGESFVRLLSNIIIFLKINLSFVATSVFIKKLKNQIYLPGTLPFLTDADKLPEIFMVPNVPEDTKQFVLEKLEKERLYYTRNFFENLHIGSSLIRKPTRPVLWHKPTQQIELPDIKTICKNRDDIEHENDEDIVFYTDLQEVYCFNVYKLYDLFQQQKTPANPYTGRSFSNRFIQTFLTRYASKPLVQKIESTQHKDLTTRLEQLIEEELSRLENNLIETENPEFISKFKSSIAPQVRDPLAPKKRISRVKEPFDPQPSKCFECKKGLGSEKVRSIFRNKEIFFCDYDCLEKNKAFK